ncbi:MAG: crossover junction endodeoxyribonuclease RuvC [Dermacoccus nishinomiyaensis]|nr:MAG: crossover junction endodeoxyribonuclease RuvC [Dermacoccus nishinomiyaensis]
MRVLAVDPGLTRCGVGVVATGQGSTLQIVTVGVIRTSADLPLHERLHELRVELDAVFERTQPDAVAVERMFARHDVSTIMGTAQASAVPMLAAAERGLPLGLHTPSEVKAAVTGNGRADKAQVTTMVTRILGLEVAPRPADAADALALAICQHAGVRALTERRQRRPLSRTGRLRLPRRDVPARPARHTVTPSAPRPRARLPLDPPTGEFAHDRQPHR